jgi:dolichyl-diphosphooligosaccharide--protein glycosyltransferase
MEGFAALDDLKNKDNAVIATWWDYGYASNLLNNVNVLHDGGTQTSPVTHYVARALLASTQAETAAILKFLARTGRDGVSTHSDSAEAINRAFKGELNRSSQEEVYLVLTSQMTDWIESIAEIGLWNEQEGKSLRIKNIPPGRMPKYRDLKCNTVVGEGIMSCRNRHYDLEKGTISGSPALLAITKSENGFQKSSKRFNNPQAFAYMQVTTDEGSPPKISLIHQRLFRSTFHQMFHLGQTDNKYFEMFLDGYPHFRVFKIR